MIIIIMIIIIIIIITYHNNNDYEHNNNNNNNNNDNGRVPEIESARQKMAEPIATVLILPLTTRCNEANAHTQRETTVKTHSR